LTEKNSIKPISFRTHIILSLVTLTLWLPIYNLLCLLRLDKMARNITKEGIIKPKNNPVLNFLPMLTFVGAPFTFFKRYQLLHQYINSLGASRAPPAKKRDKEEVDQSLRLNCIAPMKFVGFVLVAFLLLALAATCFGLTFHHLFVNPAWTSDALMILFPIAFAATVTGVAFSVRAIKEESYWVKAFNGVLAEQEKA